MINVAITDDQSIIINGLQKILSGMPGITITGTYINGDELLNGLAAAQPDVLLLDIQMPGKTGIELAGIIAKKYPSIKIIALTNFDVPAQIKKMLQQGCQGYLLKDVEPEIIVKAIETVHNGEMYIQEQVQVKLMKNLSDSGSGNNVITRREKEILQLIVEEYTNKEIADKLFLSLRTVENHRNHLLQKFKVKNTAGLVKIAIQEGLC
ncbi:MAG: response regulator transcription factor [Ferruginibacter sp.]